MMNLVKTLFKAKKPVASRNKTVKPALDTSPAKVVARKYEDLILSPNNSNYGIEVKEISIVEYDRRKKPR
ncbi:MAG: hypothetical protein ACAH10_08730 [Methylophilaceae bacterium]